MSYFDISDLIIAGVTGAVSYLFGSYRERRKGIITSRKELLEPVESWLKEAEKILGFLSDTTTAIYHGSPQPVLYSMEERKEIANKMAESTNEVLGIISSNQIRTINTLRLSKKLTTTIQEIDKRIKYEVLPLENMLLDLHQKGELTVEHLGDVGIFKLKLDGLFQEAYSIISKIKTSLT